MTLPVSSGVGVCGGQQRLEPHPLQPNWHFIRTHAAVTIVSARMTFASSAPSLQACCTKVASRGLLFAGIAASPSHIAAGRQYARPFSGSFPIDLAPSAIGLDNCDGSAPCFPGWATPCDESDCASEGTPNTTDQR